MTWRVDDDDDDAIGVEVFFFCFGVLLLCLLDVNV